MRQKIDCFLACRSPRDLELAVGQLHGSRTILHINYIVGAGFDEEVPADSGIIRCESITSTQTMLAIAERAEADYTMLDRKSVV